MASKREQDGGDADAEQAQARDAGATDANATDRECMPCRGTGKVISKLGGEDHAVDCPWCEGSGQRIEGVDAQAHWQTDQAAAPSQAAAEQANGAS